MEVEEGGGGQSDDFNCGQVLSYASKTPSFPSSKYTKGKEEAVEMARNCKQLGSLSS